MVAAAFSTIALALLAASGVSKVIDPEPTRGAMKAAGLPSNALAVRLLGLLEVLAAAAALTLGGWWAAPSALLYLGFAWFTFSAVRQRIPVQSCGCFGREDTPPTVIHVAYNSLATVALAVLVATGAEPVPWSGSIGDLAMFLGFGLVGGYLSYLLLAQLPRTLGLATST